MAHDARLFLSAGIALLLGCALAAIWLPGAFMAAWLGAWWFWAELALGAQIVLWMQRLTGGAWMAPIAAALERQRAFMPLLALLALPLLAWPGALYPWAREGWIDTARETGFRHVWLSHGALAAVMIVCVVLWTLAMRWRGPTTAARAAAGLLLFGYSVSLAAMQTLASLTPRWYSSAFGLVVLVAMCKAAMARAVAAGAHAADAGQRIDLGNLLLMYVMTWAYLSFTQFQIIWAENLPAEISWYVPRLQTGWVWLAVALVLLGFALPLLLLLFRRFKRDARCLQALSLSLVGVAWLEVMWWIYPSLTPAQTHGIWLLPLATAGMGCVSRAAAMQGAARGARAAAGTAPKGERHA
ncbi:hypothetical protein [Bordetella genomosp. 9]|uniref:Uncharacterized protein n=1 Tax=Bordetella genomosp. 9 TaxID=1416803 RepID=A0A1W6Z2D8_9BORD|nr:hypothetical protein [Bordetella genomosp. 9]ARP87500.1 hypothetical protein CAL13_15770 [Bordetella genomosp. 9]